MNQWETPRNLTILVVCIAVTVAAFGFWIGYGIGSHPQQIIVPLDAPLSAITH